MSFSRWVAVESLIVSERVYGFHYLSALATEPRPRHAAKRQSNHLAILFSTNP
jgi:hypothetical protein